MSNILVKIAEGPDGKQVVQLGVNIQMTGTFQNGIVESLGHRKMSKKFVEGVCQAMVKQIQPQLLKAIKQEHHYYEHPEDIPTTPEGEAAPPLNHALLARENVRAEDADAWGADTRDAGEGAEGNPGVPETNQEPDNSD